MSKEELYFSCDIEADGPIPLVNSMLSFGVVALKADGKEIGTYTANLQQLLNAEEDPDTMAWWNQSRHREAWRATRVNTRTPSVVMPEFVNWVQKICGHTYSPVFVAYPAGFDFTFMYVYMMKFAKESPFSFSALDMKSFAMAALGTDFRETTKKRFPKDWFPAESKHTHVALEDAREQGQLFIRMLQAARTA